MPWANNAEIDALRRKYNAALAAHRDRTRAIADIHAHGLVPPSELIESETKARLDLKDVQAKLLEALTRVITGESGIAPPTLPG